MGNVLTWEAISAIGVFLTGVAAVAAFFKDIFKDIFPPHFSLPVFVAGVVLIFVAGFLSGGILLPLLEGKTTGGLRDIFHQVGAGENMTWTIPPGTIGYQYVTDDGCRRSGSQGLRIRYDFTQGKQGGWGVSWLSAPTNDFDGSRFSALNFCVRGTRGSESFLVGLKDAKGNEYSVESIDFAKVSGDVWTLVNIPLERFKSRGVDTAAIQTLSISFTQKHGAGTICIDDIALK